MKTIDSRIGGIGDAVVALWIAEGARAQGERIPFVDGAHSDVIRAFGHETTSEPRGECMGLGVYQNTFNDEFSSADTDRTPRTLRWQRTMGWSFTPRRPKLEPLLGDAAGWARGIAGGGPLVVIAPKANVGSRSLPLQKWLRVARALEERGFRTIAIDGRKEVVEAFPLYAFGFAWPHVLALLDRADAVLGNDSGIAQIASTMGTPTVVAMGPTDLNVVFGHCLETVIPVTGRGVPCVGCHYMGSKGYQLACDTGCEALDTLPWQAMRDAAIEAVARRREATLA